MGPGGGLVLVMLDDKDARISELEACIREMQRSVPGGSVCDPQAIADTLREIARAHGVKIGDEM